MKSPFLKILEYILYEKTAKNTVKRKSNLKLLLKTVKIKRISIVKVIKKLKFMEKILLKIFLNSNAVKKISIDVTIGPTNR